MLSNAALLHHRLRLVPSLAGVVQLERALAEPEKTPSIIREAWQAILSIDFYPVFAPALAALNALNDDDAREPMRWIADTAIGVADELASLRFDHAGSLYHRLLASARYDGSFYTNNVSAMLLARLALTEDMADWSNPDELANLKIIDPACGTGTLLMAAMHAIRDRHENAAGAEADSAPLHLALVEDVLYGLDINRHGIQLAACNLTLGNPRVDYSRMNLFTMQHGPQPNGGTMAGSLEFLATARDQWDIASLTSPLPTTGEIDAERAEPGTAPSESLTGLFDLVIMNPRLPGTISATSSTTSGIAVRCRNAKLRSPGFSGTATLPGSTPSTRPASEPSLRAGRRTPEEYRGITRNGCPHNSADKCLGQPRTNISRRTLPN